MEFRMPSFLEALLLFFGVTLAKVTMEPKEGSIGGGTWITLRYEGLSYPINWSHLEVSFLNSVLPTVLCDIQPVSFDLSITKCQTRASQWGGLYQLQFTLNGQIINNTKELHCDNCTFQFSVAHTPVVYRVDPPYGVPGNVMQVYGLILAQEFDAYSFNTDFIDGPVILEAERDGWITICSLANKQMRSTYPIQVDHGLGTVACRVEGNHIGSHNVSFTVFNKGKSVVNKDAWLISAKQDLFLYQTFSEIFSVSPAAGSLGGGTDLTITGDFFDTPVQVTVAGSPCQIKHVIPRKIICTTGAVGVHRRLNGPKPGNRGLLFEVWDGSDTDFTETAPGYRWQFVPNASSPLDFQFGRQQTFRARLYGFFVAPQTNNYTFWIQADDKASLYLSLSKDPQSKVEIASIPAGIPEWSAHWEENWSHPWKPKSEKFELTGGSVYYLEAVHHGKSPKNGMRVGVQIHNTWLNPSVVNTYHREKHKIHACAVRLPEIQMLILSGTGWFRLSWDNVTTNLMSTNITAEQLQRELEDLLSLKCETQPSSAKIILWEGFEQVFQREPKPVCPHGNLVESVSVVSASPVYNVSFLMADYCKTLPLFSLRGAVPWEGSGGNVGEAQVNLTVQRVQAASPPLGGTFQIHLPNTVIPGIPVSISAHHLRKLLQAYSDNFTAQYVNASDFSVSKDASNCYQSIWTLTWTSMIGDLPNFISVSAENLTGLRPAITHRVVFDGGVFIGPIFGDMLATPNNFTQVVVTVNDIPANCSGSCTFQHLWELTPLVSNVEYFIDDGVHTVINITGSGLSSDSSSLLIEVNHTHCEVLSSNHTNAVCQMNLLPVGLYKLTVLVRPHGFAVNASRKGDIFLRILPRLTAVEPPTASEIGGIPVIIKGSGLDGIILVQFGSQPCPINADTSNSMKIECRLPPRSGEDYTAHLMLVNEHGPVVFANAFIYDPSLNPLILSLSRNRSSTAGGQVLHIGISSLTNYTCLDVQFRIQESVGQIQALSDHGISVVLPSLTNGLYSFSVIFNNVSLGTSGVEPLIQYVTEIFKMEPCCGSLLGGTLLTISGTGFSNSPDMVSVLVDSQFCPITSVNDGRILCQTPPVTQLANATLEDFPAQVEVLIGNRSFVDTPALSFSKENVNFLYKMSLTPDITDIRVEMLNDSVRLSIKGTNVTISVAMLGDEECQLEVENTNHSAAGFQCSVPLSTLEPGQYLLRILQKQAGYANIPAEMQHVTVRPLIKMIFPSHGSICGGQLLTISGVSLKSWTNSAWVNLTGNFTCEIQSSNDSLIKCALSPGDPVLNDWQLRGASQVLSVTVTVNGITSHCLGGCSLHLLEDLTLVIDAVTMTWNGRLAYLLIRGQRLDRAGDETLVEVDGHLPCNVIALNETWIKCQAGSLDAGEHSISVLSRSWGRACLRQKGASIFRVVPHVLQFYPQNFSVNGRGLLTLDGLALRGRNETSILIGELHCPLTSVTYWALRCLTPPGTGVATVQLNIDGALYHIGEINYSEDSTPVFLSLLPSVNQHLTIRVSRIRRTEDMYVFIGCSPCANVVGNNTTLSCTLPQLPAGEYNITGGDALQGLASSHLVFPSVLMVMSVNNGFGCLGGGEIHIHGTGFSPGNTSVTICGAVCEMLDVTPTDLRCLAQPLNASIAVLCSLRCSLEEKGDDWKQPGAALIQCDIRIRASASVVTAATPYRYLCDDSTCSSSLPCKAAVNSSGIHFAGLFISPKVERDEVLIYNSSCNITMETEAEMECEEPNQPITAKITEIWKERGQNTQSTFPLKFCGLWSKNISWLTGHQPQDGDNVTVERGQTLFLDTSTSILNLLHVKGGKLVFVGPGPIELHAHYILVSDGGELRVGSPGQPFCGKAQLHLQGSLHSPASFPYGAKFLAVRNGTLSMHGCVPKVTVTHLKSAARPNDTKLVLVDHVDWKPGDEVVICGGGPRSAQKQEEVVTVKTVNGTELYVSSPLRYPHGIAEEQVSGEHHVFRALVALVSRSVVIHGNVTTERASHLQQCKEADISGDVSDCFYKKSERKLGSRDMGAVVIVQAYSGEETQLHLDGVQFRHVGQAFQKHLSALTIAGNAHMTNSYFRNCAVLDSFARGISLHGVSDFRVENNIFYNIMGHGVRVGDSLDQNNLLWHNTVIGLSGTDGLSSVETLSPAGFYIQAPDDSIEGNTVCAAGHGYFFHLSPSGPSEAPVLSFSKNRAYSCTSFGLLIYPEYHPQRANTTLPVTFETFTAWQCEGGVKIINCSNLQLWSFHISSCKYFGIDIVESLGNTSVANSLLLGHLHEKDGTCMQAGLKTPKRHELLISNTTFMNFDIPNCTAIATCSGCYRGQGGFAVRSEQVLLLNAPNWILFPFPHCAILKDLDGTITGQRGSFLLPSVDTLPDSCLPSVNASQVASGSLCHGNVTFHRMSIGLKAPICPYNLKVTDSRNKTTMVSYVSDTLSNANGWMVLLLDQETYSLSFDNPLLSENLQYIATFDNFTVGNYLLLEHEVRSSHINVTVTCGTRKGSPLLLLPSHKHNKGCDWFFNRERRKLTYLVTGQGPIQVAFQAEVTLPLPGPDPVPPPPPPPPLLRWSLSESWDGVTKGWGGYNKSIPSTGQDVIILPGRSIFVDTTLPRVRGLYIQGTLEFPSNSSNVLSAACIVIAGGELRVGTLQHPLERGRKVQILLRASERVYCDRLHGLSADPGTIGVYGKLQMHSAYTQKSWTYLGSEAAPGNERIMVQDELDWHYGDNIVISSSSYEAHQAEIVTLEEVNHRSLRIHERLLHRHTGQSHRLENGQWIPLAAEIGLLTRNIQIKSDMDCTGAILVGHHASGAQYAGIFQLSNVEILGLGSSQSPAVGIRNASHESFIISSSVHQSCGAGIQALASSGLLLHGNVVFGTVGHGIHLEGQNHTLTRNLVILSKQPGQSVHWVTGIKTNAVDGTRLQNNVVAGSERIAFHIKGQECFLPETLCTDNVAHSSLHGIHLYRGDGFPNCTKITGFLSYKNYDYGIMFHLKGNIVVEKVILVDNVVGLLPVLYSPPADLQSHLERRQSIILRDSVLVATSSSFDCIKDRIQPLAADLTSTDRAPRNPWRGRVGILWPSFTSDHSWWPDSPWHKMRNYSVVLGIMMLQDVIFAGFRKTCYSDDRDICIMTNPDSAGILHLVTSKRASIFHVSEENMFYFHPLQNRENESNESCVAVICGSSGKALFKDLDGSALRLNPPVSVFPKSEFETEQPCLDAGIYREDRKCIYKPSSNVYFCKETYYAVVILESTGADASNWKPSPPVLVTDTFIDTFSEATSWGSCCATEHSSTFYSILPLSKLSKICFNGPVPWSLRLYLNSGHNATRILLAIFYDQPRSFRVFVKGNYMPPVLSFPRPSLANAVMGTNYFSFHENLLYVAIHWDEPIEIHTYNSLHVAFTIAEAEAAVIQRLAIFLQIGWDQVRTVLNSSGSESTLNTIADNAAKRKYQCPPMKSCVFIHHRASQQKTQTGSSIFGGLLPPHSSTGLRVVVLEISDPLHFQRYKLASSFSGDRLTSLANTLINAQQTGELQHALKIPLDTLVVMVSATSVPAEGSSRNGSSQTPGSCLYVRPYNISVRIQPANGVTESPLPRQPQVIFLDKQGRRVATVGFPSKPWVVTAFLKDSPEAVLKGDTRIKVQDGKAAFQNLVVSGSCSGCYLFFKVTSPPGAILSVRSNSFTIYPITVTEKSAIIFTAALGSAASLLVLGSVVICWSKKTRRNKNRIRKPLKNQKNKKHAHIQANQQILHAQPCFIQEENKHNITGRREDLKLHEEHEDTAEPLRKSHQQAFNSTAVGAVNRTKQGRRSHTGTSTWGSLELQQLSIKELNDWKDTKQHFSDYAQQKETKKGQFTDKRYKRPSEKPALRSGGDVREKQQVAVP
ncbi:fibrocystin isoform X2 [Podarcis raffonei]|uniref:fibrocystin isoform X2 n=1 Tax=Podarcis raffonei TaxID=65483 RepID=UPI002329430A|nr:fibrocystin isoform X2 [Podarcis raffonei]